MRYLLLLAIACTPDDTFQPMPPPVSLTVSAVIPGEAMTFEVDGAAPNEMVFVGVGPGGVGAGSCPPALGGACLSILDAIPLLSGRADSSGHRSFTAVAPDFLRPGRPLAFQAASLGVSPVLSAPASQIIQDPAGELSCFDNTDDDFDGLADCADDDCFAACGSCVVGQCCGTDGEVLSGMPIEYVGALDVTDGTDSPFGPGHYSDDYEIALSAGEELTVGIDAGYDVHVFMLDEGCGTVLHSVVPAGGPHWTFLAPDTAVYSLVVTSENPGVRGPYALEVVDADAAPVAVCTVNPRNTVIGDTVDFRGHQSYDPLGRSLVNARWELVDAPAGSLALLGGGVSDINRTFVPDLVGTYRAELVVTNDMGVESEPCEAELTADPPAGGFMEVRLAWDRNEDIDLHLWRPNGDVCTYDNCRGAGLEWGPLGPDGDPVLEVDVTVGFGPEIITMVEPVGGIYTVRAHDFPDATDLFGLAQTQVTAEVLIDGVLTMAVTGTVRSDELLDLIEIDWTTNPPTLTAL